MCISCLLTRRVCVPFRTRYHASRAKKLNGITVIFYRQTEDGQPFATGALSLDLGVSSDVNCCHSLLVNSDTGGVFLYIDIMYKLFPRRK